MPKTLCRIISLLLIIAMPLCACSKAGPPAAADGWFQESELSLPEDAKTIIDLCCLSDGSLALLANTDRDSPYGPWKIWRSADGGRWSEQPVPWLEGQGEKFALVTARLLPEGGLALLSLERYEPVGHSGELDILYRFVQLSPQGEATREQALARRSIRPIDSLRLTGEGELLIEENGRLLLLDADSLEERQAFGAGESALHDYTCRGDTLYLTAGDTVQSYSLSSGELTGTFDARETVRGFYAFGAMRSHARERLLVPAAGRDTLYYCDQNGIWAHADGGSILELIAESTGSSLSLPTRKPFVFCALPEGFCILFEEGEGYHLSRFQYTEGSRPENGELRVYVINNFRDGRLRQAIGLYELDTGVQVDYQVGQPVDGQGLLTIDYSDAMRTLSTELMAGNGPDVLIFNGEPPRSMIEKGVLLDLGALAAAHLQSGEWLPGIADGYRQPDGSLYGIPMSFSLPAVFGSREILAEVQDFDSFTAWAERFTAENPGLRPAEDFSAEYLLSFFYPLCHSAWEEIEKPEEPIRHFLDNISRLQALDIPQIPLLNDLDIAAWHEGHIALALGSLRSVSHLAQMASMLHSSDREGEIMLMGGFGEGHFLPGSILSINANGRREQAQQFVETVLDERCQAYEYFDGMPVNKKVLLRQLAEADPQHRENGYVIEGLENTRLLVENAWPDEAFVARFWEMVASAKKPAQMDSEESSIFFDAFFPCFYSGAPMEDQLNGYLSQQKLRKAE